MGWEDLPPVSPAWVQNVGGCDNCEKLEKMYADACSESDSLLSEIKELLNKITVLEGTIKERDLECRFEHYDAVETYVAQLKLDQITINKLVEENACIRDELHKKTDELGRCRAMYIRDTDTGQYYSVEEMTTLRAALGREHDSVNELSLANQDLIRALEQIDTLSENRGPGVSWVKIYEEAQSIARKALLEVTP